MKEKLKSVLAISLRFVLPAAIGGGLSQLLVVPDLAAKTIWALRILFAAVTVLVVDFAIRQVLDREAALLKQVACDAAATFRQVLKDFTSDHIQPIQRAVDRMSKYSAFSTSHGALEEVIDQSSKLTTRAKWIVPLFVSHKISNVFDSRTEIRLDADAERYSRLISQMLPFASNSLLMTCPYPPMGWFERLFKARQPEALKLASEADLPDEKFPAHVRAFLDARVRGAKKRFVVIESSELEGFWAPANRRALSNFLRFSNSKYGIETRFAYKPLLCTGCDKPCGVVRKDYQIWDDVVLVEWVEDVEPPYCRLELHPDPKYLRPFDECFHKQGATCSVDEIEQALTKLCGLADGSAEQIAMWGQAVTRNGLVPTAPAPGPAEAEAPIQPIDRKVGG